MLEPDLDVLVVMRVNGDAISLLNGSKPLPEGLLVRLVVPVFVSILDGELSLVHRVQDRSLLVLGTLVIPFESNFWEFVVPLELSQAFTFSLASIEMNCL